MLAQPHRHGAQAARREVDVVRPGAGAERVERITERVETLLVRRHDADHRVGMPDDVLRARVDRHVDAVLVWLEEERRGPGVVDQDLQAARAHRGGHRRDVLHVEGLRAGRFQVEHLRVVADQFGDAGADRRIEEGRLDAHALQEGVGEAPRRAVDAVGHQDMVARLQEGEQRRGYRSEAGGRHDGAVRAFQFGDGIFEREDRRRAAPAVARVAQALRRLQVGDRRVEDRRGAEDRRVDDAEVPFRVTPGMRDDRVVLHRRWWPSAIVGFEGG